MCGIVGCLGALMPNDYKAFRDLLLFDVVRGQDSTGVLHVDKNDTIAPTIEKDIGHPCNLWDLSPVYLKHSVFDSSGVVKQPARVLLGHNRAATAGLVNVDNAHPFKFGHIYGVHNGTLWDTKDLLGNHAVDSKCIYETIEKKGIEYTWERVDGAAALVWYDENTRSVHMVRNDDRTLYTAQDSTRTVLYWASEAWMIHAAFMRNKLNFPKNAEGKEELPKALPVHKLHTFKLKAGGYEAEEPQPLKKHQTTSTRVTYGSGWGGAANANYRGQDAYQARLKKLEEKYQRNSVINENWAEDLDKGPKTLREQKFKLQYYVNLYDGKEERLFFVGETLDTRERVEIYPERFGQYLDWKALVDESKKDTSLGILKPLIVKFKCRPRRKLHQSQTCYCINTYNMTLVEEEGEPKKKEPTNVYRLPPAVKEEEPIRSYRGFRDEMFTREEFRKQIYNADQCCCYCGTVFDEDDVDNIVWLSPTSILCKPCDKSTAVRSHLLGI